MCDECAGPLRDQPELTLLLRLSETELAPETVQAIRRFLNAHRKTLDWGRFLHLAGRHRLLPLSGRNLIKYGLAKDEDDQLLLPYRQVFAGAYLGNRARNLVLHEEYGRVLRALNEAGLPYLVRKGAALDLQVFADLGARQSNDLDLLIDRPEVTRFAKVVEPLGYVQGNLRSNGSVEPYSRRAQLYWATRINNSLPFIKASGTIEVDHFKLDPCHDITQRASAATVPNVDLFERSVPLTIGGVPARTLDAIDHLLDQCLHLYKEATALYYLESGKGLRLRQLADVATLARAWPVARWDDLVSRAQGYAAAAEIYYTLHFTALIFPGSVPNSVLAALRPDDIAYLDQYGNLDGRAAEWKRPFFERLLFEQDLGGATSAVPRS
jgi:hypothetical protein